MVKEIYLKGEDYIDLMHDVLAQVLDGCIEQNDKKLKVTVKPPCAINSRTCL